MYQKLKETCAGREVPRYVYFNKGLWSSELCFHPVFMFFSALWDVVYNLHLSLGCLPISERKFISNIYIALYLVTKHLYWKQILRAFVLWRTGLYGSLISLMTEDGCLLVCCTMQSGRYWLLLLPPSNLMMATVSTFETSFNIYQITCCNIPKRQPSSFSSPGKPESHQSDYSHKFYNMFLHMYAIVEEKFIFGSGGRYCVRQSDHILL
jgi:hypothetical protein